MLSSRSKKAVVGRAVLIAGAIVASGCAAPPPHPPQANANSFQNEHRAMRARLNAQTGDSGVVIDDHAILIGIVPNSYGRANAARDPSEMHVTQGNSPKLTWVCWDGQFTLTFDGGGVRQSPLEGMQTTVVGGKTIPSVGSAAVRADAGVGRYHFIVHVDLHDGGTYDDPACPPIIIEP